MKNFIFKSANGLIKNDSISIEELDKRLQIMQTEMRHQRSDLRDIKLMLNKLLIDKHLQHQVDKYFEDEIPEDNTHPENEKDLD